MTTTIRREKFEKLAQKAEQDYQTNPKKYKNTIKLLVLLGYGYLLLVLLALVGVVALSVFLAIKTSWFWLLLIKKKLIIVLLVLIYVLCKALFIKIPAPEGYRLHKKQAPQLFEQLKSLRQKIKAPRIHEIIITEEFNAAIQQTPRLGLIGWQKNTLILGLPLLMTLSEKQTIAVIAHEMGHLSGAHTKFNGWIYRARTSWMHIAMSLEQLSGIVDWMFGRFMNWYAPYFSAYTFALARANEYEADDIACQLTSTADLATALTTTHVLSSLLIEPYWQNLEQQAYTNDKIIDQAFSNLYKIIHDKQFDQQKIAMSIEDYMHQPTDYANTHPSLSDRLKPMKIKPQFQHNVEDSAANIWFKDSFEDLLVTFDKSWHTNNQQNWQELHKQGQQAIKRLQSLQQKTKEGGEKQVIENLVEQAHITHVLFGASQADPLYREILNIDKNQPEACFYHGSQLLANGDIKGLELLQPLMEKQAFIIPAGQILYQHFSKMRQLQQANQTLVRMEEKQDLDDLFYQEVNSLSESDQMIKEDLSDNELSILTEQLSQQKIISHVWIAKKPIKSYPQQRLLIIVFQLCHHEQEQQWFEWLEEHWSIDSVYFAINIKQHKKLARNVIKSARKIK